MSNSLTYVSPIPEYNYQEVIEHLRNNFFADEPLNRSVNLCEPGKAHKDLEKHSLDTLKDNVSIMAVDQNGKIAGVSLNGILHKEDSKMADQKLDQVQDEKFKRIITLLNSVNKDVNLFDRYQVDSIYECRMLSVEQAHRGRGVAKELLLRSIDDARCKGFKIFKQDATSFYTQKISDTLGFETIYELSYCTYAEDGIPIFSPAPPHRILKVMVKEL